jgi:hypothetical protein
MLLRYVSWSHPLSEHAVGAEGEVFMSNCPCLCTLPDRTKTALIKLYHKGSSFENGPLT